MRRLFVGFFLVGCFAKAGAAADPFAEGVRNTPWLSPAEEQKSFHLPPGFEIQLVAAEPDILKPMNMAFDARGRLWVTVTREYPYPVPVGEPGRDAIKILDDFDDTGRARKITTFADGLNIPIGIYPYRDGCIAWSIPNIWFFRDADGDGKSDTREKLYGPFDHTRDTHGNQASFRRGFDGWLYATHGYNNDSHVKGADGHQVDMNSGNTYRMRLDGSRLEHRTHGQVNPFGLAWDELGNLFSSDCHSEPLYQLLAGGYYPSFGKPDDGLGFAPKMMDPPRGSTALDGISIYTDDLWPADYRGNFFFGDVMASRIFRDAFVEVGASKFTRAMPDFLTTDDPWFRPVDTRLGADGALYVADFYNRIIGHYEVRLDHPGRDRTSGRIWRIVYRKQNGQIALRPRTLPTGWAELMDELNSPNLVRRMLASDEIADRHGTNNLATLRQAAQGFWHFRQGDHRGPMMAHALWLLRRLNALDEPTLLAAFHDQDRLARVHAMRLIASAPQLSPAMLKAVVEGLYDGDPLVQRCAAEALANHPAYEHISPLLALRHRVSEKDTHLFYVARKALRDQLVPEENFRRLMGETLTEREALAIADVALGVKSATAGAFLLDHAQRRRPARDILANQLRHAARYAPTDRLATLAEFAQKEFSGDPDFQLTLLESVLRGIDQRGGAMPESIRAWGAGLAENFLSHTGDDAPAWANVPIEGATSADNPWALQRRASADGDKASEFFCTLPSGESATGVLRSRAFVVPAKLSFWCAGHDGDPSRAAQKKNGVRLRAADSAELLAEAAVPRNDTARQMVWDLTPHVGRRAVLEIADGDTGGAYAWLAVGRFEPEIAPWPSVSPSVMSARQRAAAGLVEKLKLTSLEPKCRRLLAESRVDPGVRSAAARAVGALSPSSHGAALAQLLGDAVIPLAARDALASAIAASSLGDSRASLGTALREASLRAQTKIASALASSAEGAETLLATVKDGHASPRVLTERAVRDKLLAARPDDAAKHIESLTAGLGSLNASAQKLVEQRRDAYRPGRAQPSEGVEIFAKNCGACHSIGGRGGNIGPQLDGIGQRGLERLCEDVLDPNRNLDHAFRTSLFTLQNGDIVSGLFRREEGELVVLADAAGKEVSLPKKNVVARRETETSLMPENFGEVIPGEDFNHLLAYLLAQATPAPSARPR